jgi:hypothetical protein
VRDPLRILLAPLPSEDRYLFQRKSWGALAGAYEERADASGFEGRGGLTNAA